MRAANPGAEIMFDELLVRPLLNILVAIYQALSFLHIPSPLGFSIVVLTIIIRFAMYPMITSQLKASRKMQELNPHIANLKERHKGDNTRIQQETMKLYKEHGVNPASGCISAIIQMGIVIFGLYPAFTKVISLDPSKAMDLINHTIVYTQSLRLTHPWDTHFFGVSLNQNPAHLVSTLPAIMLLPLFTAVLQFVQAKLMFAKPTNNVAKALMVKQVGKKDTKEDFAQAMQTNSLYLFPIMIGFFSYQYPIGLSLYWNTFTVFGILQQYQISEIDGWSEIKQLWTKNKNK